MIQQGIVLEIRGDEARIRLGHGDCAGCQGCAEGLSDKRPEIWVKNPIHARIGQLVSVEFDPARAIQASIVLFLVPILALLAGAFLGHKIGESINFEHAEHFSVMGGFIFLAICISVTAIFDRKQRGKSKKGPRIVAVLPGDACPGAPR